MKATVTVKPAGSTVPLTPTQVSAAALQGVNAAWVKAKAQAAAAKPPAKTVYMGLGNDATMFGYFPNKLTVKAGTTVTFVNKAPKEPHNVTFGPKKYILGLQKKTDLFPSGPGLAEPGGAVPRLRVGAEGRLPLRRDEPRQRVLRDAGDDRPPAPMPLPHSSTVTFTKPGKYKFFCWIHGPDMKGEIDVTA